MIWRCILKHRIPSDNKEWVIRIPLWSWMIKTKSCLGTYVRQFGKDIKNEWSSLPIKDKSDKYDILNQCHTCRHNHPEHIRHEYIHEAKQRWDKNPIYSYIAALQYFCHKSVMFIMYHVSRSCSIMIYSQRNLLAESQQYNLNLTKRLKSTQTWR